MHNPMNRNPEENRPLDPFAAAEAPEAAAETTYPVEADGEVHELTLAELMEAAAEGLSKRNAYVRRNRAASEYAERLLLHCPAQLTAVQEMI